MKTYFEKKNFTGFCFFTLKIWFLVLVLCFKGELLHGCFCVLVFVFLEIFDRDCFKGIADMVLWILGILCVWELKWGLLDCRWRRGWRRKGTKYCRQRLVQQNQWKWHSTSKSEYMGTLIMWLCYCKFCGTQGNGDFVLTMHTWLLSIRFV